jgi:hypothetical protein
MDNLHLTLRDPPFWRPHDCTTMPPAVFADDWGMGGSPVLVRSDRSFPCATPVPPAKRRSFAREAKALDAAELRDYRESQRFTLILCLIQRARVRTRDEIVEMFLRRLAVIHKRAKDELNQIQMQQRERTEALVETLDSLLDVLALEKDDRAAGLAMRALVGEEMAIEQLRSNCAAIRAWSNNNYLPLLWTHYRSHRQVLMRALQSLQLETPTVDDVLLKAVASVIENATQGPRYIDIDQVDIAFVSDRWRKLILGDIKGERRIDRRQLEVCVFSYLMAALRSGDVTVKGSESFADHRDQLLG